MIRDYFIFKGYILSFVIFVVGVEDLEILGSVDFILKFIFNNILDRVKVCMFNLYISKEY